VLRLKYTWIQKGLKPLALVLTWSKGTHVKPSKSVYPCKSEVSFDDVLSGRKSITKKQALNIFKGTLDDKVKTTKRLFPSYDKYPKAIKTALVNGVFRGEFKSTQKTVKYINSGQWDKVPKEYLDWKDYRNSKPNKNGGIKTRMDFNAKIFREYAKELKKG
jgi:hypothetical protein